MKLLAVGDIHAKALLSYSDLVKDGRVGEREEILSFIAETSKECEAVVLLGDCFDKRTNPPQVIADFVRLLESFGSKEVHVIAGNHSKSGDGSSALDFLKELSGKENWHVYTKRSHSVGNMAFMPYLHRTEVMAEDSAAWLEAIKAEIDQHANPEGILFLHHAISGCGLNGGGTTDSLSEPVLDKAWLEQRFRMTVAGHIHELGDYGKTHVVGSVFNSEIGEDGKSVAIVDTSDMSFRRIELPGRHIIHLTDPEPGKEVLTEITHGKDSIVKITLTDGRDANAVDEIKRVFSKFDGLMVVEKPEGRREKAHVESGMEELSMERLIPMYAEAKGVSPDPLTRAWERVKT